MLAIRVPFATVSGAVLAAAVFLGLFNLVNVPFSFDPPQKAVDLVFTPQRRDTPLDNKRDPKVEREPPPIVIDPGVIGPPRDGIEVIPVTYTAPPLEVGTRGRGLTVGTDRDAIPLVRVAPDYPPRELAKGTEGWVRVRFSITPTGMVRDASVVAAEPARVFDDAALKAIARWRYNPRVEGGQAVERIGVQTVIRFEIRE